MALSSKWKSTEEDNSMLADWRVVGNQTCHSMRSHARSYPPSRRGSLSTEIDDGGWRLFKGFQWKDSTSERELTFQFDLSSSIGPLFRRSQSFSFTGQDPHLFGYDHFSRTQFSTSILDKVDEQSPHQTFAQTKLNVSMASSRRSSVSVGVPINEGHPLLDSGIIPNGVPTEVSIEEEAQVSSSPSSDHILLSETSSNSSNHQVNLRPSVSEGALSGKGIPLSRVPSHVPLYMIEFKSGRTGFYYLSDVSLSLEYDDLVIVEADRGRDLGKVATQVLTADQVVLLDKRHSAAGQKHDVSVKRIHRLATLNEVQMLTTKELDEQKALSLCLQKIKHRKLEMEIVDAEFQWDRRKLTFYFIAEKRIDFRELVRELFKTYKTRIWMCSVNQTIK